MTDDQTVEMRIRQLEETALQQDAARLELRSEVEALGDALVIMTVASRPHSPAR